MLGYRFAPSQMKHKLDQEPSEHIFCQQHVKGASSHEQNPEAAACGCSFTCNMCLSHVVCYL